MASLIRSIFEQALKTNDSLYFAVLTGCLCVSKESIFTGLNNPKIFSIADVRCDEYFEFTDHEVRRLLDHYGFPEQYDTVKDWYDGYHFGNSDVYCPWDVICYADDLCQNPEAYPQEYWMNTSGNDIIHTFLSKAKPATVKRQLIIPNTEIINIFSEQILEQFFENERQDGREELYSAASGKGM